ncbi:hypothetical protein EI94DRAFT_1702755 [Lactarius quietus]|nr:hypothetical protein EI94DRAFT_1702755 [Lactarius quietus]
MSQKVPTNSSSSNLPAIFHTSMKEYEKKTKKDLLVHPLMAQLQTCNSPADIIVAFVFSPANVIFAGAGVLLSAAKDVIATQDALIDIFERIENFFKRLEEYAEVPTTEAMKEIIVKIMVEVLGIFAIVTKEMKQGRANSEKYLKKLIGRKDIEDALSRLDRLTQEEARMAIAQVLKVAHNVKDGVEIVGDQVKGVGDQIKDVDGKVMGVSDKVMGVDDKVKDVGDKMARSSK